MSDGPGLQKVEIVDSNGTPIGVAGSPLEIAGSGTIGTADQGAAGTIGDAWFVKPTADGLSVSLPLPTGAATAAAQATGNAALATANATLSSQLTTLTDGTQRAQTYGLHQNGVSANAVGINSLSALNVAISDPLSVFGELISVQPNPRVQIDAVYGLLTTDVETLTSGTGATATAPSGLFHVESGTSLGGYAVIRSRRVCRYRPGQACRMDFTARFGTPVALGFQMAGGFTSTDGVFFGYEGTVFGLMRRVPGSVAIYRLTVSAGPSGAETITITLAGVAFTVNSAGALSTDATAQLIAARVGGYAGWSSTVSPTSNGATVTFIQSIPAVVAGAFTMTSTGTAAGSFAALQAGAANDNTTGFVAQSAWNVDRLDGSNGAFNPSGMTLDPSKVNVYRVSYSFLGGGAIRYSVMTPSGVYTTVHVIQYPNSATVLSGKNPAFRLGWIAASLGSTTNLTVEGGSAAAFVQGQRLPFRDPVGVSALVTAAATENVWLLIRNRAEYQNVINQRQLLPQYVSVTNETSNRVARIRCVLNPTLSATVNWQYVNQSTSSAEYATPTGTTVSGGTVVASFAAATQASLNLGSLDLRMEAGDVLAICVASSSATVVCDISVNWQEE